MYSSGLKKQKGWEKSVVEASFTPSPTSLLIATFYSNFAFNWYFISLCL